MSIASQTAAAMAKTPGSPPETIATAAPPAAWSSAAPARASSSRLSEAWRAWPGRDRDAVEIGAVAVDRLGVVERGRRLGGQEARVAGAEADHREAPGHGAGLRAGTSTTAK